MSAIYGKQTTYNESSLGALKVSIEDLVTKYPARDFPILRRLNGRVFENEVASVKYEWKEEDLRPTRDLLGSTVSSTGTTTIVATTAGVFNIDDVIQIESEQSVVTAVASDGVTLTVVRGWAGTTAATHTAGASMYMYRVGIAAPEGKDADGAVRQGLLDLYNRTQIFEDVVEMSGTEEEEFIYRSSEGDTNSANQITKKQQELMEMLQTALLLGRRHDDTTTQRRSMGGLKFFVDTYASTNAVNAGGASNWTTASTYVPTGSASELTVMQEKLDTLIETMAGNRGKPTAIYAGYKAIRRMTLWGIGQNKGSNTDDTRGYTPVGTYISAVGNLDIIQVPGNALDDLVFVVDEKKVGYKPFRNRGWFTKKLAENGDSHKWQVLGEYTAKVSTPKAAVGYMYNLGL